MIITVSMLSLTSAWQMVALFIILERIGKALRSPARDTILSHATKQVGTGFGIFHTSYGITLFLGIALMGLLYDYSLLALISFAVVMEIIAILVFFILRREALLSKA